MHILSLLALLVAATFCSGAPKIQDKLQERVRRDGTQIDYWSRRNSPVSNVWCGDPGTPKHGSSLYDSWFAGSIVSHSCDPGYLMVGRKLRICQSNGKWTPNIPVCILVDCKDPGEPANGAKWLSNSFLGSIAKYTCDNGFSLSGDEKRECLSSGKWSGTLPTCTKTSCPYLPFLKNGDVIIREGRTSSSAKYTCKPGYVLVGNAYRHCGLSRIWLGSQPKCRVDCGQLDNPDGGSVALTGTTFGSTAIYECIHGYLLVGVSRRTCQSNGQWSDSSPICDRLQCDSLPDIENGRVTVFSNVVGSVARYSCDKGFVLVGVEERTCQRNGLWSSKEPFCDAVDCGRLDNPDGGSVTLTGTTFGSTATYECIHGYRLVGVSRRTCQSNGQWSDSSPICDRLECDSLSDIENGRVSVFSNVVGSVARYSCDKGFVLVGVEERTCQRNGLWSSKEPFCDVVDCGRLDNPDGGSVTLTGTTFGSTATYECIHGYRLVGVSRRTCQSNGQWSDSSPICDRLECDSLPDIKNGRVSVFSNVVGSVARYSCDKGFVLVGVEERTCQRNGLWSSKEPFCDVIDCGRLDNPDGGSVALTGTTFGSTATYECIHGYLLVGVSRRTCQSNGQWSDSSPACEKLQCDSLSDIENGRVSVFSNVVGSVARYSCDEGFVLVGVEERTCQRNGLWSSNEPFCDEDKCEQLSDPKDGVVTLTGIIVGSVATYSCRHGFILVGVEIRVCLLSGVWSASSPTCQIIDCGTLSSPDNGEVLISSSTFGSIAEYSCDQRYKLTGNEQRTCRADGTWSGQQPSCTLKILSCSGLPGITNGQIFSTGTAPGSLTTYICDSTFRLNGNRNRVCLVSGEWSGEEPTCTRTGCGDLNPPTNGDVSLTGVFTGSVATYSCNRGLTLVGVSIRVCLFSGVWSATAPVCEVSFCEDLRAPQNGGITFSNSNNIGSQASYTCISGFNLIGVETRRCQNNGVWSGFGPFCEQVVTCLSLESPKDGVVSFTSTLVGSRARYSCIVGFELVGDDERICQEPGRWSGREPICRRVNCGILPLPQNGAIDYSLGTFFSSFATYSCFPSYELVGGAVRVCQESGVWSEEASICRAVICPELFSPSNGALFQSGDQAGSRATYTCEPLFGLVGSESRICQDDGVWSGLTPLCEPTDCVSLKPPEGGDVEISGTGIGAIAAYSCEDGFELSGEEYRTCLASGIWSDDAPTCIALTCETLPNPADGRVVLSGNLFRDTATYSCNQGFVLFGQGIRVCNEEGIWTGKTPECREVDCGPLSHPDNGEVSLEGTTFGFLASYICDTAFNIMGSDTRVCEISGLWSGSQPVCTESMCGSLPNPENGMVVLDGTDFGSRATYKCNPGFTRSGPEQRTCLANGEWNSIAAECFPLVCKGLVFPENGAISFSGESRFGSLALYTCNEGYTIDGGEPTRVCGENGHWIGLEPFCQLNECGVLGHPINGEVTLSGITFGSEATYFCRNDYVLEGERVRICNADESWSGVAPTCRLLDVFDCGRLTPPLNGFVTHQSTTANSIATYSCRDGYFLQGGNHRQRCIEGLGWDGIPPTCQPVDCGRLVPPPFGSVTIKGVGTLGSMATYTCDDGHHLQGFSERRCEADGEWTGEIPTCIPVDCGPLRRPLNGLIFISGTSLGFSVTYSCNIRFDLIGDEERVCQSNGEWSGEEPICREKFVEEVDCGDPGTPVNGRKESSDYSQGSSVLYVCDVGYQLAGPGSRTCLSNGRWSGVLPTCEDVVGQECSVEGDTVFDSCGRRCTCRQGRFSDCCRLRRDYASLTENDKKRYIDSVLKVATDSRYKSKYDSLVSLYSSSFDTLAQETKSNTSQFFVWNRFYMIQYENLLREIDCRVTIPYWDWTALPLNPYMSTVFSPSTGFGDSSRPNDSCVRNGPFRYESFQVTPSAGGGCLQRQYRLQMYPTRAIIEQDVLTLPAEEFPQFHQFMQLFVFTNVRCFLNGHSCTNNAANDPVFLLHLAQIDFIFDRWQRLDSSRLNVRYAKDTTTLALSGGKVVSDYADNTNLAEGIQVCYGHPTFKDHIPERMQFLSTVLLDITNNHDLKMSCVKDEMMDHIALDPSGEEFMNSMCDSDQ